MKLLTAIAAIITNLELLHIIKNGIKYAIGELRKTAKTFEEPIKRKLFCVVFVALLICLCVLYITAIVFNCIVFNNVVIKGTWTV